MGRFETIDERIEENAYFSEEFKKIFKVMLKGLKKDTSRYDYFLNVSGLCAMSGKDFLTLDINDIKIYFKDAAKSMTPSSLRSRLNSFKSIARACDESTKGNLYDRFAMIKLEEFDELIDPKSLPSYEEIDKVLSHLKLTDDMTTFVAISLALRMSLTTDEVCSLTRGQFYRDGKGNYGLYFKSPVFGGAKRHMLVPDDIADMIGVLTAKRKDVTDESFLLVNKRSGQLNKRTLQQTLKDACIASGVAPFTINQLRTLSIAQMFAGGAKAEDVANHNGSLDRWFFRLERVIKDIDKDPVRYNHISIRW